MAADIGRNIEAELELQAQLDGEEIDQSIAKFCIIKSHRVRSYWKSFETYSAFKKGLNAANQVFFYKS